MLYQFLDMAGIVNIRMPSFLLMEEGPPTTCGNQDSKIDVLQTHSYIMAKCLASNYKMYSAYLREVQLILLSSMKLLVMYVFHANGTINGTLYQTILLPRTSAACSIDTIVV